MTTHPGIVVPERFAQRRISVSGEAGRQWIDSLPALVAGGLLRRLAVPAPAGPRTLASVADGLAESWPQEWEAHGRPFPRRLLDESIDFIRNAPAYQHLLINTDLHYENVLAATREPWLVIDPKVVIGDVEYGIAPLIWNLYGWADVGSFALRFEAIVEAAGVDRELARGWTIVRTVDYWLWAIETGLTESPTMCTTVIESVQGGSKGHNRTNRP